MKRNPHNPQDQRNLILAVAMSAALILAWQLVVEVPKRRELAKWNETHPQKSVTEQISEGLDRADAQYNAKIAQPAVAPQTSLTREERIRQSPRVQIRSGRLEGSIALKGLRFDDLRLTHYRETLEPGSPNVTLLSPSGGGEAYFAQAGWISGDNAVRVPGDDAVWQADSKELIPGKPVTFRWDNGAGQRFVVKVSLDESYMFTLEQRVENSAAAPITLVPYAYVNRAYNDGGNMHYLILHEGPLGVLDGALSEIQYDDLKKEGPHVVEPANGWLGFTDKYWLTALVPESKDFKASFNYYDSRGMSRYQAEYTMPPATIAPGSEASVRTRLFAGAKEITALDRYAKGQDGAPPVPLFDRAVDFGSLYFLTKPMFLLLNYFYTHTANFGIAIVLLTLVVKGLMFPLANKGYHSTTQLRALQPEMLRLREAHGKDRVKMQQEILALYKKEKVNPAAGCFPVLIQIPVFFALYKVLFVTIEMRHAPFFGWLKDLSAPDPSNIFTAFGMLNWMPPSWLHIGILPILMGVTMAIQMSQQPKPTDPTQAMVIKMMPYFLTIVLAKMPAGLVFYWTCSNTLSILQQLLITRRFEARQKKKAARAAKA